MIHSLHKEGEEDMTYEILDNRNNTDLEKGLFASLPAIKAKQFGRDVFSSLIKFKDLEDFLQIFPEVQRDISQRKVASVRRYVLSSDENNLRFFSSITVTSRGHAFYDDNSKRLALDVNNTKLSINDGQHRFEGIRTALKQLEKDFLKSKNKEKSEAIRKKINELEEMAIPMVIFSGLEENEEKQLFHDLNNLAQRPSKNSNIKLNQSDYTSKLARELAEYNPYLKKYGVEMDKASIHSNNPNTVLLATIYNSIRELYHENFKKNKDYINISSYREHFTYVNEWLDDIFDVLPKDIDTKGKYVLDKGYALKAIFRFIGKMELDGKSKNDILKAIKSVDFSIDNKEWEKHGGSINKFGRIEFFGGSNGGYRAILNLLNEKIETI